MITSPAAITALLVDEDPEALAAHAEWLASAGFQVSMAASFLEAKALLSSAPPTVLITAIRLGAYNGLQLALQQRFAKPSNLVIVIDRIQDRLTEGEARRLGATYLVEPLSEPALIQAVQTGLARTPIAGYDNQRRWPRTRLENGIPAAIDGVRATIVDIAYGGFRAEVTEAAAGGVPLRFVLRARGMSRHVMANRVWESQTDRRAVLCGAALDESDLDAITEWRRIVDGWQGAAPA